MNKIIERSLYVIIDIILMLALSVICDTKSTKDIIICGFLFLFVNMFLKDMFSLWIGDEN